MRAERRHLLGPVIASLLGVIILGLGPTAASAAGTSALDLATYNQPSFVGHEELEITPQPECTQLKMNQAPLNSTVKSAENFSSFTVEFYADEDCVIPAGIAPPGAPAALVTGATHYKTTP